MQVLLHFGADANLPTKKRSMRAEELARRRGHFAAVKSVPNCNSYIPKCQGQLSGIALAAKNNATSTIVPFLLPSGQYVKLRNVPTGLHLLGCSNIYGKIYSIAAKVIHSCPCWPFHG